VIRDSRGADRFTAVLVVGREACTPLSSARTKMAAKLQEFVAHGSAVNCLQFGRKSGAVMVTGGEDKKVNVWAIGRPNAILSLTGHTSSVECVTFDSNESTVIAGSAGGTLKLWDLEQAKVARTLTGHRSNCISVQVYTLTASSACCLRSFRELFMSLKTAS